MILNEQDESLTIIENPEAAEGAIDYLKHNGAIQYHTAPHKRKEDKVDAKTSSGTLLAKIAFGGSGGTIGYNVLALVAL